MCLKVSEVVGSHHLLSFYTLQPQVSNLAKSKLKSMNRLFSSESQTWLNDFARENIKQISKEK